jgi:outer membrane receptor for monomeric catechols
MIDIRVLPRVVFSTVALYTLLFGFGLTARAQTDTANPALAAASNGGSTSGTGELQTVTVTGYLVPHIGEGPQPVTSYDQTYIQNTGYQNVTDVLQNLPGATVTLTRVLPPGSASRRAALPSL